MKKTIETIIEKNIQKSIAFLLPINNSKQLIHINIARIKMINRINLELQEVKHYNKLN